MFSFVAAQLGVATAAATTIVNIILKAGTVITLLGILSSLASGGATTLMTIGWAAFKETVKGLAKKSKVKAVLW